MKNLYKVTKEEIIQSCLENARGVLRGGSNLMGVNFKLEFSEEDTIGVDLSGANLIRSNLINCNLSGANLSGANLSGANLSGAILYCVVLDGVNLSRAKLKGVDINAIGMVHEHQDYRATMYPLPIIQNIHQKVYELTLTSVRDNNGDHMSDIRAKSIIKLAGSKGKELEHTLSSSFTAASLIYYSSDPTLEQVPNWEESDEYSLTEMRKLANQ